MRVMEDRSEMQAPGICIICETAPQGRVVDTNQSLTLGFPSHIEGRKYVCEGCVAAMGEQVGLVSIESRDQSRRDEVRARAEFVAVVSAVRDAAQAVVDGSLEELAARVVVESDESEPESPDLHVAQDVPVDPEPAPENDIEEPQAQDEAPKRSRKGA